MANASSTLPPGVYVIGKAVGDFVLRSIPTKSGKTLNLVEGQVLAGQQFVRVEQSLETGESPILFRDGEDVIAPCVAHWKADGLLKINVKLRRPDLEGAKR